MITMFGEKSEAKKTLEKLKRKSEDIGGQIANINDGNYEGPKQITNLYDRVKRLRKVTTQTYSLCMERGYNDLAEKASEMMEMAGSMKIEVIDIARENKVDLVKKKKTTSR